MDFEKLKSKLKKYSFDEFKKEIQKLKRTQNEMERVLNKV